MEFELRNGMTVIKDNGYKHVIIKSFDRYIKPDGTYLMLFKDGKYRADNKDHELDLKPKD